MPPKFSLQNVLNIRHDLVEALEIEFSRLLNLKMSQQAVLDNYLGMQADLMLKLTAAQTGELDLFNLKMLHENILSIDIQIKSARSKLAKICEAVNFKQAELIKARQNEETLETLKNKRLEVYNAELAQYEANVQDDIYISQAFRNRGMEGQA
jgi:flagellar export protein FliJ